MAYDIQTLSDIQTIASQFTFLDNVIITQLKPYHGFGPDVADKGLYNASLSGNPVMCDVTFLETTYQDSYGNTINTPRMQLETVIITTTQAKSIVSTQVQGRDGTVKEYIGMGDWKVDINLIITSGTNGVYPRDAIADLMLILKAPVALPVSSWYLQQLGIDHLVVDSYSVPQTAGAYSQQPITITCSSDTPLIVQANADLKPIIL